MCLHWEFMYAGPLNFITVRISIPTLIIVFRLLLLFPVKEVERAARVELTEEQKKQDKRRRCGIVCIVIGTIIIIIASVIKFL